MNTINSNGSQKTGIAESPTTTLRDETKQRIVEHRAFLAQLKNPKDQHLKLLDPALDLWTDENPDAWTRLGPHAWRLVMLFGMGDLILTLPELGALLGLEPQAVRRLLARWSTTMLRVEERKVGRTKQVLIPLGSFHSASRLFDTPQYDYKVLRARAARDLTERAKVARRGTEEGVIAWQLAAEKHRADARYRWGRLYDGDDWAALVEKADEEALYAFLKDRGLPVGVMGPEPVPQAVQEPPAAVPLTVLAQRVVSREFAPVASRTDEEREAAKQRMRLRLGLSVA